MPDRVFTTRHQRFRVIMDSAVVVLLVVAVFQQNQNRDLANQIHNQQKASAAQQTAFIKEQKRVNERFATVLIEGCRQSNGARIALKNLLVAVAAATRSNPDPNQTQAERQRSIDFFDKQIAAIHTTDCSQYHDAP